MEQLTTLKDNKRFSQNNAIISKIESIVQEKYSYSSNDFVYYIILDVLEFLNYDKNRDGVWNDDEFDLKRDFNEFLSEYYEICWKTKEIGDGLKRKFNRQYVVDKTKEFYTKKENKTWVEPKTSQELLKDFSKVVFNTLYSEFDEKALKESLTDNERNKGLDLENLDQIGKFLICFLTFLESVFCARVLKNWIAHYLAKNVA